MQKVVLFLLIAMLALGACGPNATPTAVPTTVSTSAPTSVATAAAQSTTAGAATPTAAAQAAKAAGSCGTLRILYWQGPTILNSHLAQGTKDYDAARLCLNRWPRWVVTASRWLY